ncbi:MAG: hypothetical protein R3A78_07760 [Polyangiales bacterium]|nr:hypothetical protein [Myxococcales bacterium]
MRSASILGPTVLVLGVAGCIDIPVPAVRDGGPWLDAPSYVDTDDDGLCDETELGQGTDPKDQDSDDDGVSDFIETNLLFDPLSQAVPPASWVVTLPMREGAKANLSVTVDVQGTGEDFTAYVAPTGFVGASDLGVDDVLLAARAAAAVPPSNVASFNESVPRFEGVLGATSLTVDLDFEYPGGAGSCLKPVPFRVAVKRNDGAVAAEATRLLVAVPEGQTLRSGTWCNTSAICL